MESQQPEDVWNPVLKENSLMTPQGNVSQPVMSLLNCTKTHHQTSAYKLAPRLQTCTMTHPQWHASNNVQMDGLPMMPQENACNYVHQLLLYTPTLTHSDVLTNVLNPDTSSLQILRDHADHIVHLQTLVICMLITPHGLVLVFVLRSSYCIVLSTQMMWRLEHVWTAVQWWMGRFITLLIIWLKAVFLFVRWRIFHGEIRWR